MRPVAFYQVRSGRQYALAPVNHTKTVVLPRTSIQQASRTRPQLRASQYTETKQGCAGLTLPESLRLFGDKPVTRLDVGEAKSWKELPDEWKDIIRDVFTVRASDEESGLLKSNSVGVLEWEVTQLIKGPTQYIQRDSKFLDLLAWLSVQISKKELSNRE